MNFTPEQIASMQSHYTGRPPNAPSLMSGDVPTPKTDQDAVALIQQSKAMIDANGGIGQLTPEMKLHVNAVISALEKYAVENPKSSVAQRLIGAIQNDPALAPYL